MSATVIGGGSPTPADEQLLQLQIAVVQAGLALVASVNLVKAGVPNYAQQIKVALLNLQQSVPMTLSAAQGYVGTNITASCWSTGTVFDYQATLTVMQNYLASLS